MTVGWNWRKRWDFKLILKFHCTHSSENGTSIINDVGRQAAHKKTTKIHVVFFVESRQTKFFTMLWRYNINFQRQESNFQNNYQAYRHYHFKEKQYIFRIADNLFQILWCKLHISLTSFDNQLHYYRIFFS